MKKYKKDFATSHPLGQLLSTTTTKKKNTENNKCWKGCGEFGTLVSYWWEQAAAMENSTELPQKIKNRTTM